MMALAKEIVETTAITACFLHVQKAVEFRRLRAHVTQLKDQTTACIRMITTVRTLGLAAQPLVHHVAQTENALAIR